MVITMNFTDDQISAFVDGELPENEQAQFLAAMAQDAQLAARVEQMQSVNNLLLRTYDDINHQPLPDAIAKVLRSTEINSDNTVVPLFQRGIKVASKTKFFLATAACLTVAILIGVVDNPVEEGTIASLGMVDTNSELYYVLENQLSGNSQNLANGNGVITPELTFATKSGELCREFSVTQNSQVNRSLACKENGNWNVLASEDSQVVEQSDYNLASGGSSSEYDKLIEQMMATDAFSIIEEQSAKQNKWQ